jgi:hypothetical protein
MVTFSFLLLLVSILHVTVNVSGQLTTELLSIKKARGDRGKQEPGYIKELFQKISPELIGEDIEGSDHGEEVSSRYPQMKGKKGKKGYDSGKGKGYESGDEMDYQSGKGYNKQYGKKNGKKGKKGKKGEKNSYDSRFGCRKGKKGNEECGKGKHTDSN